MENAVLSHQRGLLHSHDGNKEERFRLSNALGLAAVVGAAVFVWVIYLFHKKRLREDHAILWMGVSIVIVALSTWTTLLVAINNLVGTQSASNVVLAAFVALLIAVSIFYSVKISELTDKSRRLAQEIALIKLSSHSEPRTPEDR